MTPSCRPRWFLATVVSTCLVCTSAMSLQLRAAAPVRFGSSKAMHTQRRLSQGQLHAGRRLAVAQPAQHRQLPRRTRHARHALADAGGDERVQDGLVDMLNVQIGQQHVKSFFEDESERLRRTAEEVRILVFSRYVDSVAPSTESCSCTQTPPNQTRGPRPSNAPGTHLQRRQLSSCVWEIE